MAGALPSSETSRPNEIHLPGSAASVFTGGGTVQHMMRCLFKSRSRLGSFARSFAAQHFEDLDEGSTAQHEPYPMLLPYPEVFGKKRELEGKVGAGKRYAVFAVILLNYLHLNRPRTIAKTLRRGQRLSARQWEVVRTLESYAEAWFNVSPIGPEEMGRTARLEALLHELEVSAEHLAASSGSYLSTEAEKGRGLEAEVPGARGSLSTFKPIESSRLKFVGRPLFDPRPYLDPLSKKIYEDPLRMRDPITAETPKPPRLRIHCSKNEKIKLFELLDSTKRLSTCP